MTTGTFNIIVGDNLEVMRAMPADSVDLVLCSPPYDAARSYGIDFKAEGEAWVEWAKPRFRECLRISRGLVAWVVEGTTRDYSYSCSPFLLMADLKREGVTFRKPMVYKRIGIPGSGGPDWFRNDWEPVLCATKGGKLAWSNNVACGAPPKYGCFGGQVPHGYENGDVKHVTPKKAGGAFSHRRAAGGRVQREQKEYAIANPGNVIEGNAGGGHIGDDEAHENEAPFPEWLAERYVLSCCPPGGTVCDPFSGSGTTAKVAVMNGRNAVGIDVRESQKELAERRIRAAMNPTTFRDMRETNKPSLFSEPEPC